MQDVNQRLVLYKRLAGFKTAEELAAIVDEMVDRFGEIPPLVDSLIHVMDLRRSLKDLLITAARVRGEQIVLEFHPETPVHIDYILAVQKKMKDRVKVFPDARVGYRPLAKDADGLVAELKDLLERLR